MKLEHRIKISVHDTLEKYLLLSMVFCLFSFALPMHSKAENDALLPESSNIPSYNGKLDLSLQQENNFTQSQAPAAKNTAKSELGNSDSKAKNKEIRLHAYPQSTIRTTEDGSNLMIVQGSRFPYHNEYNSSSGNSGGFYMNVTNPDGSAVNFGSFFNSSSSTGGPRRQSRSQIIIDKQE